MPTDAFPTGENEPSHPAARVQFAREVTALPDGRRLTLYARRPPEREPEPVRTSR